jgi:hypothetical protein
LCVHALNCLHVIHCASACFVKLTLAIRHCYARSVSAMTLHDLLRQIHAQPATSWTREDKRVLMDIVRKLLRETTEARGTDVTWRVSALAIPGPSGRTPVARPCMTT